MTTRPNRLSMTVEADLAQWGRLDLDKRQASVFQLQAWAHGEELGNPRIFLRLWEAYEAINEMTNVGHVEGWTAMGPGARPEWIANPTWDAEDWTDDDAQAELDDASFLFGALAGAA